MYVCMYVCMYVYNISGGVVNIFYQSCVQINNNQQVYEAHIQVSRCNSILKAGSLECQKLRPLNLDRCTSEHTDHNPKTTHLNVCMLSSVWARSCFLDKCFHPSPNISTSIILIYTLFYHYYHHFYFYTFKGWIYQITTKLLI